MTKHSHSSRWLSETVYQTNLCIMFTLQLSSVGKVLMAMRYLPYDYSQA